MRLADTVQEWLEANEWDDSIDRNEETGQSSLGFSTSINDQSFRIFVDTDENKDLIKIYVYAPFNCLTTKTSDCLAVFNRINSRVALGKILLLDDNKIVVRVFTDVENADPSIQMIENMVNAGIGIFGEWFDEISSVALTKKSAQEIFDELDNSNSPEEENNVPDEV